MPRVVAERLGDAERRGQTVERRVELTVVDVRARDATNDRRRGRAIAGAQQVERRLVATPRDLALAGALRPLRLLDERRDRRRQAPRRRAATSLADLGVGDARRVARNHLLRQRRARDAEQSRRRGLIAAGDLERERDRFALDVLEQLAFARDPDVADRVVIGTGTRRPSLNHQMLGADDRRIRARESPRVR